MKNYSIRIVSEREFEAVDDDDAFETANIEWLDEHVTDFVIKEVVKDAV